MKRYIPLRLAVLSAVLGVLLGGAALIAQPARGARGGSGRPVIVDFTPPPDNGEATRPAERGNDGTHGVTPASVSRETKEAGFENLSDEAGSDRWFMVVGTTPR